MSTYNGYFNSREKTAKQQYEEAKRIDLLKKSMVWGKTRVILIKTYGHPAGREHPVSGSLYKCVGRVLSGAVHPNYCMIRWDNGYQGMYLYDAIEIIDGEGKGGNPNTAFAVEKMRKGNG